MKHCKKHNGPSGDASVLTCHHRIVSDGLARFGADVGRPFWDIRKVRGHHFSLPCVLRANMRETIISSLKLCLNISSLSIFIKSAE